MQRRPLILSGMIGGAVWGMLIVLWLGPGLLIAQPFWQGLAAGLALAALPMVAMIGRLAQRRFFDDSLIDGQAFAGASAIDQRVLTNTAEQLVLALCLWPFVAVVLGGGTALALGAGFAVARLMFWVGYHAAPPLRAFGFAASFYPTVIASLWALVLRAA